MLAVFRSKANAAVRMQDRIDRELAAELERINAALAELYELRGRIDRRQLDASDWALLEAYVSESIADAVDGEGVGEAEDFGRPVGRGL